MFRANDKQQEAITNKMTVNEVTHKQWQKEQEFEGSMIIQELMKANQTKSELQNFNTEL